MTDWVERTVDVERGDHTLRVRELLPPGTVDPDTPWLVFLHDSLGAISVWRDFPDQLARAVGLPALIYDRRGYGRSSPFGAAPRTPSYLAEEADALMALLTACGVDRAVLFGHSDGGSIALLAAARHPHHVAAVISEAAHVFVEEITLAGIREAREQLRTTDLRERLERHHGTNTDSITSAWIDVWLSPEFRAWNIESVLPAVTCPLLVLQGEHDEYGSPAQVEAIVRGVRGPVDAHLLSGVMHSPHRTHAARVVELVREFLTTHDVR